MDLDLVFAENFIDRDAIPFVEFQGKTEGVGNGWGGVEGVELQVDLLRNDTGSVGDPGDAVIFDERADVIRVVPAVVCGDEDHGAVVHVVVFEGLDDVAKDGIAITQDFEVFARHPAVFVSAVIGRGKVDEHQPEILLDLRKDSAFNGWLAVSDLKYIRGFGFGELTQFVFADDHDGAQPGIMRELEYIGSFGVAHVHKEFVVDHAMVFHANACDHGCMAGRCGGIVDGAGCERGVCGLVSQCHQVGHGGEVYGVGTQTVVADDDDAFDICARWQGCGSGCKCGAGCEGGGNGGCNCGGERCFRGWCKGGDFAWVNDARGCWHWWQGTAPNVGNGSATCNEKSEKKNSKAFQGKNSEVFIS